MYAISVSVLLANGHVAKFHRHKYLHCYSALTVKFITSKLKLDDDKVKLKKLGSSASRSVLRPFNFLDELTTITTQRKITDSYQKLKFSFASHSPPLIRRIIPLPKHYNTSS